MDFEDVATNLLTSALLIIKYFFFLIVSPYKTLRKISLEGDYYEMGLMFFLVAAYFYFANFIRKFSNPPLIEFVFFLTNFFISTSFFYLLAKKTQKNLQFKNLLVTFSYTLFPTLIWFWTNSLLYLLLPPPRTLSIFGRAFSVAYTAFSLSLLIWKVILVYLSMRFSLRLNFYKIAYFFILYLCFLIPYSIILYSFRIFRIPFV